VFGAIARFWTDSARTKIPSAKTAAIQKINRAALDIFILLSSSTRQHYEFLVESQLTLCNSSVGNVAQTIATNASSIFDRKP
jgi:hypothetical protein